MESQVSYKVTLAPLFPRGYSTQRIKVGAELCKLSSVICMESERDQMRGYQAGAWCARCWVVGMANIHPQALTMAVPTGWLSHAPHLKLITSFGDCNNLII